MHAVHELVLDFITAQTGEFGALALAVFTHQFNSIAPYRRYCERRGATPDTVGAWREIPPVPVLAFKEIDFACGPAQRVFLTTGTSRGSAKRGRHAMSDLRLYRASAVAGLRRCLFPDVPRMPIVSLIPAVEAVPESSLSQMVSWAVETFGTDASTLAASPDGLDCNACVTALCTSERSGTPLCMMTTTAALIQLLDYCASYALTFRLPHGCRLMDTGGTKGASRLLSRRGLLQACWNTFAVPGYFCVNEYGMAELSSQFYDNVICNRVSGRFASRYLVGQPWTRVRVLDPATLDEVPDGERGLLCLYDLANAGTALAVLTEDIGRMVGHGFEVVGRVADAEARGCSLSAAEWHPAA